MGVGTTPLLTAQALRKTAELGGAFVLLGSAPVAGTTAEFENLREELEAEYPLVKLLLMYSDPLSHHLYAAADFVLVPSMFEPCGLTQVRSGLGLRLRCLFPTSICPADARSLDM